MDIYHYYYCIMKLYDHLFTEEGTCPLIEESFIILNSFASTSPIFTFTLLVSELKYNISSKKFSPSRVIKFPAITPDAGTILSILAKWETKACSALPVSAVPSDNSKDIGPLVLPVGTFV